MTPTTELCPVKDAGSGVRAAEQQQPGSPKSLTLYALTDELSQLLAVRAEMAEAKEDTAAVDAEIDRYMEQLPAKVDAVAHVMRTLESQEQLATEEIARLTARRRQFASMREKLAGYVCAVLEQQPKPKRGSRKLEGKASTLALVGNGGLEKLDIADEALIPDEYCEAQVHMSYNDWLGLRYFLERNESRLPDNCRVIRSASNSAVREALAQACWACEGSGHEDKHDPQSVPCYACGGDGRTGVPGAQLLPRGAHLEIR